jgi:phage baseplate assembly protein gpV
MDLLERIAELEHTVHRMQNSPCIGIVADAKNDPVLGPVARYSLPDQDGKTTAFIQVAQKSTLGTAHYHLPRIGERMIVHKLHNGPEGAFANGSLYGASTTTPPQGNTANEHVTFDDGSTLTVTPSRGMNLVATTPLKIDCGAGISISLAGDYTINAGATVQITAGSPVTITAPNIVLNGCTIDSAGNLHVVGTLIVEGAVNFKTGGSASPNIVNTSGSGGGS